MTDKVFDAQTKQFQQDGIEAIEKLQNILEGIKEGLEQGCTVFPINAPALHTQVFSLLNTLYALSYQEVISNMSKKGNILLVDISPKQQFYVAEWNDDETIPDGPDATSFDSLEEAKEIPFRDNARIYTKTSDDKFKVVSVGEYDPDLDAVVWEDMND